MTREEAIKIVRNIYQTDAEKEALGVLIPELAESEDEKMIDEIINTVTGYHPTHSTKEINEMVAWLKKQEEKKLEYPFTPDECIKPAERGKDERIRKEIVGVIQKHYPNTPESYRWISYLEKQKIKTEGDFGRGYDCGYQAGYAIAMNEMKPKIATTTLDSEKQKEQEPVERWQYVGEVDLEKDKAIEILEDYLKWAVSMEGECLYTWNELAGAIRLGIDAMKEKKPNIELIQKSWYMEGYHDREYNKEPKWIIKTGEGGPRYEENPKYGQMLEAEQKPVEYLDKDKVYAIMKKLVKLAAFSQLIPINSEEYKMIDEITCDIHKLLDYPIEQKPAEKQDYSGLNELEQAIHRGFLCAGVKNVPVNIIKETAQDCLAHLPVEWSEEDEDVINGAIGILLDDNEPNFVFPKHSKLSVGEIVKRLKSLRPSWKPSDEQLRPLEYAIDYFKKKRNDTTYLESLYNDLKKLK